MADAEVHFELFVRRNAASSWTLDFATEDRAQAVETAEAMLADGRAIAVRVTREVLDSYSGEYRSVAILTKGLTILPKSKVRHEVDEEALICVAPADLYTVHARERIGRLLEGWLKRNRITPFELLHRPDLIEKLDASGLELQGAVQKIAIPEAQARGVSVHEVIRRYQKLVEAAVARVLGDHRQGHFPQIGPKGFSAAVDLAQHGADPAYLLGAAVAQAMAPAAGWIAKIDVLLDLAEIAPAEGLGRALAFRVLEQPLGEILGSRAGLADLAGEAQDLGGSLALMTRLVAPDMVETLSAKDPAMARRFQPLSAAVERLARWLDNPGFEAIRSAMARRILAELNGPRRLHPSDPEAEILTMRALARVLIYAGPRVVQPEEVHAAFVQRSKGLITADFVQVFLERQGGSALAEVQALVRLGENVVGAANKRASAKWLKAVVGGLRFERELRTGADTPASRLAQLADLQHHLHRVGLVEVEQAEIAAKIGEIGGLVESDAKLIAHIGRAPASAAHRLLLLMKFAAGETAPLGPAATRARAEALRLIRAPELRADLAASPELVERVKGMMAA